MKLLFNVLILIFLQLHSLVYSKAPTTGCDAISDQGRCYKHFTSSAINWQDARDMCLAWGGDLATVTSLEENTMMFNSKPGVSRCWIGLNDIDVQYTFVWADGNESTYRQWKSGEPYHFWNGNSEDCVEILSDQKWNDEYCGTTFSCYFCSTTVSPFGEQISSNTYTALKDNSFLYRNTTLYCITETNITQQVTWSFTNLYGVTTILSGTTNATTGVSTIYVTNDKRGYYSCVVSQNGGNTRTYTTVMLDFIIGAPVLTLNYGCSTTFSLLPPAVNRADIPVLTQNVILSANLVGRWQIPDGSYVNSDSITIPILYVSHAGLYKFYAINWDGVWTLVIQIDISPVETYTQTTMYLTTETTSQSSMLVAWSLSEINSYNSEETFSVYFEFGNFQFFAGTTKNHSLEITGLAPNFNYTVRVDLRYAYSAYVISATTHHLLSLSGDTNPSDVALLGNTDSQSTNPGTTTEFPTNTEPSISYTMYTFIAVHVIFVTMLILVLLICVFFVCTMKRLNWSKLTSLNNQIQLPQIHGNEIHKQIETTHPMAPDLKKSFLYSESPNVSETK